jgi:hypothetical protein
MKEMRKTMKYLGRNSRSAGRDLNLWSPEYEAGMLPTPPPCFVHAFMAFKSEEELSTEQMVLLSNVKKIPKAAGEGRECLKRR